MTFDLGFDALSDPVRREILAMLARWDELDESELAAGLPRVGSASMRDHVAILRRAWLVTERLEGRRAYYSLSLDGPARQVLSFLSTLYASGLDDMKVAVELREHHGSAEDRPSRAL